MELENRYRDGINASRGQLFVGCAAPLVLQDPAPLCNGTNVSDNARFIRKFGVGGRESEREREELADHYAARVVIFHYRGCRLQMRPPRLVRRNNSQCDVQ